MMTKRIAAVLMAFVLVWTMAPIEASAETDGKFGNYSYKVLADGTREITGYEGSAQQVAIPSQIDGKPVTSIGDSAFMYSAAQSVTIPDSVTNIGVSAFEQCNDLVSIKMPSSLTAIGQAAFRNCNNLQSIAIPDGVKSIQEATFTGCSNLKSVELPAGVTSIGEAAFIGCSSLTGINLPAEVTAIGNSAFEDCINLNSIMIPAGVASIGDRAFAGDFCLLDIYFSGSESQWQMITIGIDNEGLSNATIQYGIPVTQSTNKSITDCSISVTDSVVYTGASVEAPVTVIDGTRILTKGTDYTLSYKDNINIGTATVTITGAGSYTGSLDRTFRITVENGTVFYEGSCQYKVTGSDEAAFAGLKKDQAIKVSIPETVTYGGKDFNVTAVAANALMDTRVTGVVVGDNVVTIGKYAFEDCAKLKSVTLGAKVTTIGTKAFKECGKLAKITIKSTALESVGKKAFSGIKSTARIKVPAGRLSAYKALLKGKGQGKKVKIFT